MSSDTFRIRKKILNPYIGVFGVLIPRESLLVGLFSFTQLSCNPSFSVYLLIFEIEGSLEIMVFVWSLTLICFNTNNLCYRHIPVKSVCRRVLCVCRKVSLILMCFFTVRWL